MTAATEPDFPSRDPRASTGCQEPSLELRQAESKKKTSGAGARHSVMLALVICILVASYGLLDIDDLLLRVQTSLHIPSAPKQGLTENASNASAQCHGEMRNSSLQQDPADQLDDSACAGRRIYIYKLPPQFNQKLIENCANQDGWPRMCYDLSNRGLGAEFDLPETDPLSNVLVPRTAWFKTNQFSLELLFHERLKSYPCLTDDPERATMSYIPFYSALDLTPNLHETSLAFRDQLSQRLVGWLQSNSHWEKTRGNKHVMVLGRIAWDYLRPVKASEPSSWGSVLLNLQEFWNVTKLSIERNPWNSDQMAVPYPTSFHPSLDSEMLTWQSTIRTAQRDKLVVFVGSPRQNKVHGTELRRELIRQCSVSDSSDENNTIGAPGYKLFSSSCTMVSCNVVRCARNPQAPIRAFLESVFCLQPPGDSATRKGVFDCLIAGSIPVLFDNRTAAQQYQWHLPQDTAAYAITLDQNKVMAGELDVVKKLLEVPSDVITTMQANINNMLPRLIYKKPGFDLSTKDAFDHTIDHLLQRFHTHVTM